MKKLTWMFAVLLAVTMAAAPLSRADDAGFAIDSSPSLRPEAREVVGMYRYDNSVAPGVPIPDGYVDGGRGMGIHSNGRVTSRREILVVDRASDKRLQASLAFARSREVTALPPRQRAMRIQKHIHYIMGHRNDRRTPLNNVGQLQGRYRGKGVLIGDIGDLCNDGVCRHQSLLFKILADEAGLNVALVRGNYRHSDGRIGGHAWNELHLDNGAIFLFDVQNSRHFYGLKTSRAAKYLSMAKRALYPDGLVPRRVPYITTVEETPTIGKMTLKIVSPSTYAKVHYTLDGSPPTNASPLYTKPVPLNKAATVKTVAIYGNGDASKVVSKTIRVLKWKAATAPATRLRPGLQFRFYTAEAFKALPDFSSLTPERSGRVPTFDISPGKGKDNFAMLFTGYVRVSTDGVYVFSVNSDDGSKLWIGGDCVVDNGGRHAPQTRSGAAALRAGLHPLKLGYFEYVGDESLSVTVRTPDGKETPIPASALLSSN